MFSKAYIVYLPSLGTTTMTLFFCLSFLVNRMFYLKNDSVGVNVLQKYTAKQASEHNNIHTAIWI